MTTNIPAQKFEKAIECNIQKKRNSSDQALSIFEIVRIKLTREEVFQEIRKKIGNLENHSWFNLLQDSTQSEIRKTDLFFLVHESTGRYLSLKNGTSNHLELSKNCHKVENCIFSFRSSNQEELVKYRNSFKLICYGIKEVVDIEFVLPVHEKTNFSQTEKREFLDFLNIENFLKTQVEKNYVEKLEKDIKNEAGKTVCMISEFNFSPVDPHIMRLCRKVNKIYRIFFNLFEEIDKLGLDESVLNKKEYLKPILAKESNVSLYFYEFYVF